MEKSGPVGHAEPKWRRRKDARPGEIVAAAAVVFAERGFAAARLEDVAARAGVSKAALYRYFPTKTDLFRAVVEQTLTPNLDAVRAFAAADGVRFEQIAPAILQRVAQVVQVSNVGGVAKMVIGESRNFPDLAKVWHDAVAGQAIGLMTELIARAQARGEVRPGDPRLYALSVMGPMVMGLLWREVFTPVGGGAIDLPALAAQHAEVVLRGMVIRKEAA